MFVEVQQADMFSVIDFEINSENPAFVMRINTLYVKSCAHALLTTMVVAIGC